MRFPHWQRQQDLLLGKDVRELSPEELILPFHEQGGTPTGHSRRIIGAAAGRMHAILLTEDNCVFAFGSGEDGQVGVDCVHTEDTWVHVPIPKTEKFPKFIVEPWSW